MNLVNIRIFVHSEDRETCYVLIYVCCRNWAFVGNGEVNPWDQFSKANPNSSQSDMVASTLNQCLDDATSIVGHGAVGPTTSTTGPTTSTAGPMTSTALDANHEELSKEKDEQQKDNTSGPMVKCK